MMRVFTIMAFYAVTLLAHPVLAQPVSEPVAPPVDAALTPADAPVADPVAAAPAPPAEAASVLQVAKPVSQADFLRALNQELEAQAKAPVYTPPGVPSLFLTPQDYARLQEARQGFAIQKDDLDIDSMLQGSVLGPREISLQGIVYRGAKDWVIWLNKEQMTPDRLPLEILDITVHRDFIELRWFDRATNKTYPIRLRPNQRFNIDARIFLPG
ncbi:MAG: hypothetical protein V4621_07095 [Pseudomonadota bacterium]